MKINTILETVIPGLGYELVEVVVSPAKLVQVFIDKPDGIAIEDCERVSDHLSKLFLVEEIDYNRLEISSPGVERPLKKLSDYTRFSGKEVKVKLHEAVLGSKVYQGKILEVHGNEITLELADDKKKFTIDFSNIGRARLIYDFRADLKK